MSANTKKGPEDPQTHEPAKGGLEPPHKDPYPSGDSSKLQGDPIKHLLEEQQKK